MGSYETNLENFDSSVAGVSNAVGPHANKRSDGSGAQLAVVVQRQAQQRRLDRDYPFAGSTHDRLMGSAAWLITHGQPLWGHDEDVPENEAA